LDHFSSSYGKKILVCFYASQCTLHVSTISATVKVSNDGYIL